MLPLMFFPPVFDLNERLPKWLEVKAGQPLISLEPRWCYREYPLIGYHIPFIHASITSTIIKELSEMPGIIHGTRSGDLAGCNGLLCKRYSRYLEYKASVRRSARERKLASERAAEEGREFKGRKPRIANTEFERMMTSSPQYGAVDPLIVLLCITVYKENLAKLPRGSHPEWADMARNPEKIPAFLHEKYGKYVDLGRLSPQNQPSNV